MEEVHARIAPRFARLEPRERVLAYVRGLLAPLEREELLDAGGAGRGGEPGRDAAVVDERQTGMPMRCVMMSAATWWNIRVTSRVCWSWMRPGS